MSRKIKPFREFARRAKRLQKKFHSLGNDLKGLIAALILAPRLGKSLGAGFHKIRLGSASKGGDKRGGFRVITYYVEQTTEGEVVYLVTIYDKSEEDSIAKADLLALLKRELDE